MSVEKSFKEKGPKSQVRMFNQPSHSPGDKSFVEHDGSRVGSGCGCHKSMRPFFIGQQRGFSAALCYPALLGFPSL